MIHSAASSSAHGSRPRACPSRRSRRERSPTSAKRESPPRPRTPPQPPHPARGPLPAVAPTANCIASDDQSPSAARGHPLVFERVPSRADWRAPRQHQMYRQGKAERCIRTSLSAALRAATRRREGGSSALGESMSPGASGRWRWRRRVYRGPRWIEDQAVRTAVSAQTAQPHPATSEESLQTRTVHPTGLTNDHPRSPEKRGFGWGHLGRPQRTLATGARSRRTVPVEVCDGAIWLVG